MKIHFDTEFIEDGRTIDLISIGMVAGDGREYYAVVGNMLPGIGWLRRIGGHPWLLANVAPSLPVTIEALPTYAGGTYHHVQWDRDHPDWPAVKSRVAIADEVRDFILAAPDPELWAWYAAYDHVALCQLWGPMADLPEGVPMWTNDLKQEAVRLGDPRIPQMPGEHTEHNALSDARECAWRDQWLADYAAGRAACS